MIQKSGITFLLLVLFSAAVTAQNSGIIDNYIKSYRAIAIEEMKRTGVPAAIKLAQGIHETMAGQSELVKKSNNHFGIKCKGNYSGPYVLHDDDAPNERFIKYDSPEQSYIDHSDFLKRSSRYAFLFELDPLNYQGWANGLKKAGYATNPRYPQLIISLIEKYSLQDYTLIAMGKKQMPEDMKELLAAQKQPEPQYPAGEFKINETRVVYARKGTSLEALAATYNLPVKSIYDFNDFREIQAIIKKDQLVFLQLKRTLSEKSFHEVAEGETLYDIAQNEGIRLSYLLKYNNLIHYSSPDVGSKLYLQDPASLKATVKKLIRFYGRNKDSR